MTYGYARVSSRGQQIYGNSLEAQDQELRQRGCDQVFSEAYTGAKMERPVFTELLDKLTDGDTLMVTKLDRFARTANEGYDVVKSLVERGVSVDVLNMGRVDNTITGRLMLHILFAFAEYEHDTILERFNTGKEVKRLTDPNYKEGRKPIIVDLVKLSEWQHLVERGDVTITEACKQLGISRAKWYRLDNASQTA